MWYYSLKQVVKNIREGCKWRRMRDVQIPHKHERSKNAIYPAGDGEKWIKYVKYLHQLQYQIRELIKQSEDLSNFSCTLSMRKRLREQNEHLNFLIQDAETTEYLLRTQYDELRTMRVEIRVLQYKVAVLLREKGSRGSGVFSKIFQLSSSPITPSNSSGKYTVSSSRGQQSSHYSRATHDAALSQGRGSCQQQRQAVSAVGMIRERRRKSRTRIPPKWDKILAREKNNLVPKLMVCDIVSETLSSEKVSRVSSNFGVSRDDVEAISRYLDTKSVLV